MHVRNLYWALSTCQIPSMHYDPGKVGTVTIPFLRQEPESPWDVVICPNHVANQLLIMMFVVVWSLSCVWLLLLLHGPDRAPLTHQAPLPMEFSRQKYWNGLPFPPPGDLLNPGIKPMTTSYPTLAGRFFTFSDLFLILDIQKYHSENNWLS